jgi:8-oxo-dGTP pyrophosphatase MutT (NUDIX family)
MKRRPLLSLLYQHTPSDQNELQMWRDTIQFIEQQPDCFERTLSIGHVTGSAWIVDPKAQKVLLMHHRKLDRWFQPGGHADGESDILKVALKEATEETGLTAVKIPRQAIFDVDVHLIPANPREIAHYHYDIRFLLEADATLPLIQNAESKQLAWIPYDQVAEYNASESIVRMLRKTETL